MLVNILPGLALQARLGERLYLREWTKEDLEEIAQVDPENLFLTASHVWNRIVFQKLHPVDPRQLADHYDPQNPKLHEVIGQLLGIEVIHDIYVARGWPASSTPHDTAVELMVAHTYPNDLYLSDIAFKDRRRPITAARQRSEVHEYEGFGLLPELMQRLEDTGRAQGVDNLTLTAATREHVRLFMLYGFTVERNRAGLMGLQEGRGIPMEKRLSGGR